MLLREVCLYSDSVSFDGKFGSDFDFRAYHIGDFITRRVRALRLQSSDFSRLAVRCCLPEHPMDCKIEGGNFLVADVSFAKCKYDDLASERDFQEFVIELLLRGVELARKNYDVPHQEIKDAVEEFRRSDYRNEWIHKKRLFRGMDGLRGWLKCKMDSEKFTLTLRLEKKGVVLYESEVLETKPDALCFHYRFNDLVVEGNKLIVTSRISTPLVELDLSQLSSS